MKALLNFKHFKCQLDVDKTLAAFFWAAATREIPRWLTLTITKLLAA